MCHYGLYQKQLDEGQIRQIPLVDKREKFSILHANSLENSLLILF